MRYGFTGTRRLEPEHYEQINTVLGSLADATEFTTGGALGVDGYVVHAVEELFPWVRQRIIFPADFKAVDREIYDWANSGGAELIQMPPGSSYRDRNARILDYSEVLISFPLKEAALEKRSGTWMTIRMAQKRDIPTQTFILQAPAEHRNRKNDQ